MFDNSSIIRCRKIWKLYGPGAEAAAGLRADALDDDYLGGHGLVPAVRDATLDIRKGEIFVIMGLSGSGKSTLVRCMTGLIEATRGDLFFGEDNLRGIDPKRLIEIRRHKISMVFQDFALLPHLTVLDNIAFPLRVQGIGREERLARARELTDLVALKGREDRFPHELSGGQQQRVGIARSLTTDPEVWFLDEPFSALDPLIRHEMQDEFLRLQATLHKTIVFITHDFEEAIRIADRIAIMQDGRIVQVDTPEQLILKPADEYVAEFTRKIPRHRVMRTGSLAGPATELASGSPVLASALIADVASRVLTSDRPVPVVDAKGAIIGAIDRERVINTIFAHGAR
ncbi:quaternary amine ABC transporter ATP-binding protein [Albidovulum sediminicola]|uniref:Quaternary amine transport ATP-binding protein n=1 Tax=Albidovulum sediminicola TaxID=2984331 RepID=A0ABT2Z749_9RHOB|nr:betaine/proline/choline family ABC transporter ATP-binding protein [Defluviimonas sp. WL0075]MCV2866906.1 betaine/proline/choline family ABC transporter ATP-binding protein [Defluviimonas sp. WL0075]